MVRASFGRVFGMCMCVGPVGVASADLVPVSQERSVMAQAVAGTPAGESHSASDFGSFSQGANAMSSASPPLEPNNASSSGGAQQDSQIGATLVTVSGSASAGATSLVGTSSASALSHFKLVFTLASPQRVTLDGEFFNESPTLGGNSPYLTDGQGSAGVSLSSAAGGDPLYATGSGPPIPIPVAANYTAVLPAGQYILTADASASASETHFSGPLSYTNAASFNYHFTLELPEPTALAPLAIIALTTRRMRNRKRTGCNP